MMPLTVTQVLSSARQVIALSEARLLLASTLSCDLAWLAAHGEYALSEQQAQRFHHRVHRRAQGEPIAYLIGTREFYGRCFSVTPDVLIPRPETELLVDTALFLLPPTGPHRHSRSQRVLELGTGSGCVAISLALERPDLDVVALDYSVAALTLAQTNARQLGAAVRFFASDWFSALGLAHFDLILSNPPYVAVNDPHLQEGDVRFEPLLALSGSGLSGRHGLNMMETIIAQAPRYLNEGGFLVLEHGAAQADDVRDMLSHAGFARIIAREDLAGISRVCAGCLPVR
jgi:release factor glutamine methyltransferase